MQDAGTVLEVLRERGRKDLPCDELYRQMFNKSLYLLAYGNISACTDGEPSPAATRSAPGSLRSSAVAWDS